MTPDPSLPPRPSLEELIRFKRQERPPPEFWESFDQRLREKQLTALMTRRRGWRESVAWVAPRLLWGAPAAAAAAWVGFVVMRSPVPLAVASVEAMSVPVQVAEGHTELAVAREEPGSMERLPEAMPASVAVAVHEQPVVSEDVPVRSLTVADLAISLPPAGSETRNWVGESGLKGLLPQVTDEPIRRPRAVASSWSRSNRVVLAANIVDESSVVTRVVPLDLRVSRAYATNLPAGRALPDDDRWSDGSEERALRSAMSRAGKGSSSLALRF